MPLSELASYACAIRSPVPQAMQERLRSAEPPVIARVSEERVLLDVRCLDEEDLSSVSAAVASVV